MNQQSEHLSNAQIEQYGKRASGAGPETEAWVETHLDDCPSCRSRVLEFQRTQFALLPNPKVNTVSSSNCPSEEDLRNLAAGLHAEPIAKKLKAHVSNCERCGPLLQEYIEDFSDESSPEEQAFLNQLRTASPEYRQQKAREMLQKPVIPEPVAAPDWRRFFSWKWIMVPALPAVALIAVGIWYLQRDTPAKVEKLLAQTYTEDRTMEMRIPYAKHSDFHQVRGDTGSLLNLPDSYREASVLITSNLKKRPDDPKWLLLSARFDLLHWDYRSAFSTLERINDPNVIESSEARLTRALALYEKAEAESQQRDQLYAEIVELMGKSLQKNPDDPTALFNQAIACEKSHMYECAIGDYKHLLDVEKDRGWAGEANQHLRDLQEKKNRSQ